VKEKRAWFYGIWQEFNSDTPEKTLGAGRRLHQIPKIFQPAMES
jgi:hypothetical protein